MKTMLIALLLLVNATAAARAADDIYICAEHVDHDDWSDGFSRGPVVVPSGTVFDYAGHLMGKNLQDVKDSAHSGEAGTWKSISRQEEERRSDWLGQDMAIDQKHTRAWLAQALGVSASALIDGGTGPTPRIRVLRRGQGAGGVHPAPWESLGPAAPGGRIDFGHYQIPPSIVLGPSPAHASGTVEHMYVATGTVRVTVGDKTAALVAGDSCSCRTDAPHGVENPDPSAEALIYLIVEQS